MGLIYLPTCLLFLKVDNGKCMVNIPIPRILWVEKSVKMIFGCFLVRRCFGKPQMDQIRGRDLSLESFMSDIYIIYPFKNLGYIKA